MNITNEQKIILLKTARKAVINLFEKTEMPELSQEDELFNSKSGIFVTITKRGNLRGCIGFITSDFPLKETIIEVSELAATRDPRFPSVEYEELNEIEFEISVLSEPYKINSYDEITVGEHGLIVEEKNKRGLLLPQVPLEHNLNKEEYLSALCGKAGLPSFFWKEKMLNLKAFTATVFSEEELGLKNE